MQWQNLQPYRKFLKGKIRLVKWIRPVRQSPRLAMLGTPHQRLQVLHMQELYLLDKDNKPMLENKLVDYAWMARSQG